LGEKYRKVASELETKNADGTIDNYSDQKRQTEFLIRNKYDKSLGLFRVDNTEDLQAKYQQEFDYSNQATFLANKAANQYEDINEYLKNEDVAKFYNAATTDAERAELLKNPVVEDFYNHFKEALATKKELQGLVS